MQCLPLRTLLFLPLLCKKKRLHIASDLKGGNTFKNHRKYSMPHHVFIIPNWYEEKRRGFAYLSFDL
jgi:hypothetical protein